MGYYAISVAPNAYMGENWWNAVFYRTNTLIANLHINILLFE